MESLLVHLKNAEGIACDSGNQTIQGEFTIIQGSLAHCCKISNEDTSVESAGKCSLFVESQELLRDAFSALLGERSLEYSVCLDNIKWVGEGLIHL